MILAVEAIVPSRFNPNVPQKVIQKLPVVGIQQELIKIHYHDPDLQKIEVNEKGDFMDLRAAENYTLKQFEYCEISFGISALLPPGYSAIVMPRSSTFKKFGIIQANSVGLIDSSFCGDNDIWKMPVIAMRDTKISKGDRIAQFGIFWKYPAVIDEVDHLDGPDRGGIGEGTKDIDEKDAKAKEEITTKDGKTYKAYSNGTIII